MTKIDVIIRPKNGPGDSQSVYQFKDLDDAGGFISDVFKKFGNDITAAVAVDGQPVQWALEGEQIVVKGPVMQ